MTDPTPSAETPVFAARPHIDTDGQRDATVETNLVSLIVDEAEGGLSRCEAEFSNVRSTADGVGLAFEDDSSPLRFGVLLTIGCGPRTAPVEIFRGRITGLEGAWGEGEPRLTVLAEDALLAARLTRRSKTHAEGTLADLVRSIAGTLGLTPQITGCTMSIGEQVQLNESDLAFLRRVLSRYDADAQVVGGDLHVAPRADVDRGSLRLGFPDQLVRVRVLADLAHQVSQVTCTGWDAAQGARISATSSGEDRGPGSGLRGPEILARALGGERAEHLGFIACRDADEATALVNAHAATRGRRFVTVEGVCSGDPRLRVGTRLALPDLGNRFSTTAVVVRARHRFDLTHGYRCEFTAESAFLAGGDP